MALSYAGAARRTKKTPPPGRPPPKANTSQCDHIDVSTTNQLRINELERRTQILRRVPPTTTPSVIIEELQRQLEAPVAEVVEAVVRDCLDKRRFYIRYVSVQISLEKIVKCASIFRVDAP